MPLDKIYETNVSNDFRVFRSGEPAIAINPMNDKNLVMVYMEFGIDDGPTRYGASRWFEPGYVNSGLAASFDGGETWEIQPKPFPALASVTASAGVEHLLAGWTAAPLVHAGDPIVAAGPDGTFYAAASVNIAPIAAFGSGGVGLSSSSNGGRTWTEPVLAAIPIHRPWLHVDQSTGTVYLSSFGTLGQSTDRWVVASHDKGRTWTSPKGIAGGDAIYINELAFSTVYTSTITTAHGVLAAAFQVDYPASVAGLLPERIPPHTFFQTSTDEGATWERHRAPVTGDGSSRVQVSADPTRPGRFAVCVLNTASTEFMVVVTEDSGKTWTDAAHVTEDATRGHYMQWMEYSATGVLGLVWRSPTEPFSGSLGPFGAPALPYDIWTAISPDGGESWSTAVRVNAAPSPATLPAARGGDELSWITFDRDHVHVVWADWRGGDRNSWYGRVPISAYGAV